MTPDQRKKIEDAAEAWTSNSMTGPGAETDNGDYWTDAQVEAAFMQGAEFGLELAAQAKELRIEVLTFNKMDLEKERDALASRLRNIELANKEMSRNDHASYGELLLRIWKLRAALEKIGMVDHPSVADKTSWIVMCESICALAREALEADGNG